MKCIDVENVVIEIHDRGRNTVALVNDRYAIKLCCGDSCEGLIYEARLLSMMKGRGFVELIDCGEVGECSYLVRGFSKHTLRDYVGKLSMEEILEILRDLAEALRRLHLVGYVLTDLKPENVGYDDRTAKVLDLDAATPIYGRIRVATSSYAPPEFFNEGVALRESDVYQLALLIHELATSKLRNPAFGEELEETGLPELDELLRDMTNPVPVLRPSTREVIERVNRMLSKNLDRSPRT